MARHAPAAAYKYVDPAAVVHLLSGLTFVAARCAELIDRVLDGSSEKTYFAHRMVEWIREGAPNSAPRPRKALAATSGLHRRQLQIQVFGKCMILVV